MGKFIYHVRKHLKVYSITAIVSLVLGVGIFCLYYFLRDRTITAAIDGVTMAGVILLGVGLLCLLGRFGAYDTMSYGFKQMFASMFAKEANKYNNMAEYKEDKRIQRESSSYYYVIMMIVSLLFFIAFAILEIYKVNLY